MACELIHILNSRHGTCVGDCLLSECLFYPVEDFGKIKNVIGAKTFDLAAPRHGDTLLTVRTILVKGLVYAVKEHFTVNVLKLNDFFRLESLSLFFFLPLNFQIQIKLQNRLLQRNILKMLI